MTNDLAEILHRCRATLATALADTPETLADPTRQRTLECRMDEITAVLELAKGQGVARTEETRQKVYGGRMNEQD